MNGLKITCPLGFPPSPEEKEPRYWRGDRPCKKTNNTVVTDYDYDAEYAFTGATYDANGNIATYTRPIDPTAGTAVYEYEDGRLTGAHTEPKDGMPGTSYRIEYDGELRALEYKVDDPVWRYHYVYDDDGRLIAEGPPVHNEAPVRLERDFFRAGAGGHFPVTPMIQVAEGFHNATATMFSYHYDAHDRFEVIGVAGTPGFYFSRYDYGYDAQGRLMTVALTGSEDSDSLPPQTWNYAYDCAN